MTSKIRYAVGFLKHIKPETEKFDEFIKIYPPKEEIEEVWKRDGNLWIPISFSYPYRTNYPQGEILSPKRKILIFIDDILRGNITRDVSANADLAILKLEDLTEIMSYTNEFLSCDVDSLIRKEFLKEEKISAKYRNPSSTY